MVTAELKKQSALEVKDYFFKKKPRIDDSKSLLNKEVFSKRLFWLVVSTHLKNNSQNGSFSQVGVKILKKNKTTT